MEQLLEDWAITRWWRKSLDVFFISIPLFDIQFFVSSLPKPPVFVIRVPGIALPFYNVLNVNFKISGCNILQKSVILSSHERLTNDNAERHGKSWIFRFFLGQLGACYFLRNVDPGWSNRILSHPGGDQGIYPIFTQHLLTSWLLTEKSAILELSSGFNQHTLAWNHQVLRGFSATPHFGE